MLGQKSTAASWLSYPHSQTSEARLEETWEILWYQSLNVWEGIFSESGLTWTLPNPCDIFLKDSGFSPGGPGRA